MALQLLAAPSDPALLDLPWGTRLEEWPEDQLVVLPRGISRHVVRVERVVRRDQVGSRSPLSVENRWTWPCFGAKLTLSPLAGGRRPSTRAMMS